MMLPQRTSAGTIVVPLDALDLENRTIHIEGEINDRTAAEFIQGIIALNRLDSSKPIKVLIMSHGGSVIHGMAMYDAICTSQAPVETYCIGTAYSMGAILFVAGAKRYILEHSKVMLHEPLVTEGLGGNASSIKSMSDTLQDIKKQINELLCKHTGRTMEEMEEATGFDHYFSAEEAIKFGLADEVVGIEKII